MASLPEIPTDSALSRLFETEKARGDAVWFSLPGGATLYNSGEPSDTLYFVRAGRLGAFRRDENGESQFLGVIRPGERPLHALRERGVEYVEVRMMDLDPFVPVGIRAQTIRFLDVFLLHCLLAALLPGEARPPHQGAA